MFSGLVEFLGYDTFVLVSTLVGVGVTPVGLFVRRKRPILGTAAVTLGVAGQLVYGSAVVSETVRFLFIG